jgi:hypothetical protein
MVGKVVAVMGAALLGRHENALPQEALVEPREGKMSDRGPGCGRTEENGSENGSICGTCV